MRSFAVECQGIKLGRARARWHARAHGCLGPGPVLIVPGRRDRLIRFTVFGEHT